MSKNDAFFQLNGNSFTLENQAYQDLELKFLTQYMNPHTLGPTQNTNSLKTLMVDTDDIKSRQILLSDLLDNHDLAEGLKKLIPLWDTLTRSQTRTIKGTSALHMAMGRLGELIAYGELVQGLSKLMLPLESKLKSEVWHRISDRVREEIQQPDFPRLIQAIPRMKNRVSAVQGISIGINLSSKLEPTGVVLLDIHDEPFVGRKSGFLGKLFSTKKPSLGELHTPPLKYTNVGPDRSLALDPEIHGFAVNPQSIPIFREMGKALEKSAQDLLKDLKEFSGTKLDPWIDLAWPIQDLLSARDFCLRIESKGLSLVFPQILPMKENRFECLGLRNLALELSLGPDQQGVANDALFNEQGRLHVITGPNKGGKTVYLQAVGLAQILFQAGLPIPAERAAISPVRNIFTHYPLEEKTGRHTGRFGDELIRFKDFFDDPQTSSLVLLNESLTGTGAEEAELIAADILGLLRRLGCRGIFTTHLHSLAKDLDKINESIPGPSKLISLAAQVILDEETNTPKSTYRILPGPPPGKSYARNLALHYGLDFRSLEERLPNLPQNGVNSVHELH